MSNFLLTSATFALNSQNDECPLGSSLQFKTLATKYVGYCQGKTSLQTTIKSKTMTIPQQIYDNGFTVQLKNKIIGPAFISCVYNLQDNISGTRTENFKLSSATQY